MLASKGAVYVVKTGSAERDWRAGLSAFKLPAWRWTADIARKRKRKTVVIGVVEMENGEMGLVA